jgi:peptidyl-prolyl cis-trans isomerase SurA
MVKRVFVIAAIGLLFLTGERFASAGEVIDRIVATVNGHIILQSDWDDAVCFEAFSAGHPLQQSTSAERKSTLDRLIDQELLREQMRAIDFQHATSEAVAARVAEIRRLYPGADSNAEWHAVLARYRLSEDELKKRVGLELDLLRSVDARLRPTIQIDSRVIESYYSQELLPQLRQAGAKEVSLAEVTPKIKELLIQQKLNQLLTGWLETLRAGSEIHSESNLPASGDQAQ